jgi:beta-glucosidase
MQRLLHSPVLHARVVLALAATLLVLALPTLKQARAAQPAGREDAPVYQNAKAPLEERVEDLLSRLTPKEKVSLMAGGSLFSTYAIDRLNIPALRFSDGPNGVRSNEGEATTVFPTGSALAATWNPEVVRAVGQAIAREALALNIQVLLGPNVNIQRSPLGGRNFEAYSEDPYLAGRVGIGFVNGVQSQGVGTSVKHYVANEQETDRMRGSSNMDERTLREIYLLPFEMLVREAHPWTVMASYNRLNGTYATENPHTIQDILKGEWRFDGVLMSDWGAVHTTVEASNAGLDLEMPGPPRYFGAPLVQATRNWQVEQTVVDEAARRMLRLIVRSGVLDGQHPAGELRTPRNRGAALAAASEAITLLKNDRALLPLDKARVHTLAVIGPNADVPLYQGGGSASVVPSRVETPLQSLRALAGAGVQINYAQGADNDPLPPPADARLLSPTEARTEPGLRVTYYSNANFSGTPTRTVTETYFGRLGLPIEGAQISARFEGFFWAPREGTYEFSLGQVGEATLYIDDRKVLGRDLGTAHPPAMDFGPPIRIASVPLSAGGPHRVRLEYVSLPFPFHLLQWGIRLPSPTVEEAVQVARGADAAVVFVGSSRSSETEGHDRGSMELTPHENELVEAVLAANPNTIVVLNSGSPLALPWADKAPTVVQGWLAGEEGPHALAQVLLGEVNPSGKLPFTFPRRLEDNPAYLYYSPGRDANYGEGVFVGYRYYEKRKLAPLFPFGHGLSYTTFEYGNLRVPSDVAVGQPISVSVDVRNTGKRAGRETVQLYVGDEATTDVVRPAKELKAFQKVSLAPGESTTIKFTLTPRDLSYYDVHARSWRSTPGTHRIYVGSSSADIRASQAFQWTAPQDPRTPPPDRPSLADFF